MTANIQIINLGLLPGNGNGTAYAISGNGAKICGWDNTGMAFQYDQQLVDISVLPTNPAKANSLTYYGDLIVGSNNNFNAYVYDTRSNQLTVLPNSTSASSDFVTIISPDGSSVCYHGNISLLPSVYFGGVLAPLNKLAGSLAAQTIAYGVANQVGSTYGNICGSDIGAVKKALYWASGSNVAVQLFSLPGLGNSAQAYGISADGNLVAGYSLDNGTGFYHAVVWDIKANTTTDLGNVAGYVDFIASAISPNGKYIAGTMTTALGDTHAFRWDAVNLFIDLGVLSGETNSQAFGVADNGDVVGIGDSSPLWFHVKGTKVISADSIQVLDMPAITHCLGVGGIFTKV